MCSVLVLMLDFFRLGVSVIEMHGVYNTNLGINCNFEYLFMAAHGYYR